MLKGIDMIGPSISIQQNVNEFVDWLNEPNNRGRTSKEKVQEFLRILGFTAGTYRAIDIQPKLALALRELLAQVFGEPGLTVTVDKARLNTPVMVNGDSTYEFLGIPDLQSLNKLFGLNIPVIESLGTKKTQLGEDFSNRVASVQIVNQREDGVCALVDSYVDSYAAQTGPQVENGIFLVRDHFTVQGSYVIGGGLCSTAAYAMQMAKISGIEVQPMTSGELVSYKNQGVNSNHSDGNETLRDDMEISLEKRLEDLLQDVKTKIDGLGNLTDAEKERLKQQVDLQYAKRNLGLLIDKCDQAVNTLYSSEEIAAAREIKSEVDQAGGIDSFIEKQKELLRSIEKPTPFRNNVNEFREFGANGITFG